MGWTWQKATNYYKNGKIDRKKECDELFSQGTLQHSRMVGTTYYAAVKDSNGHVWAAVILTKSDLSASDGLNFGYKTMDETCGPLQHNCPQSVLKLLSPTDNAAANEWRRACRAHHVAQNKLRKLDIGTRVRCAMPKATIILVKRPPNLQFDHTWWQIEGQRKFLKQASIPSDFIVL